MNPDAKAIALSAYGLSEQLWGLQPKKIDAKEFIETIERNVEEVIPDIMGLHGPKPEVVERAAKSIAMALGRDASEWSEFILHAQAALIGALDPDNRFSE